MVQSCQVECSRFQPQRAEQKYNQEIEASLTAAQQIVDDVFVSAPKPNFLRRKLVTLEVYAGVHSPLTSCLQDLGAQAYRFTKLDGDLSTFSGRQKLWKLIDSIQPDHIFVAPECGPWGGWNRLNAQKSVALWNHVQDRQAQEKCHIRLCAQLCQYQVRRNRQFHLEQPSGSAMIHTPEFQPISKNTQQVCFDMCRFGLKIPNTDKFLRKSSQIWTTSENILQRLYGVRCKGDHEHAPVAGTMYHEGRSIRTSTFCATYCHGFASAFARAMCEDHSGQVLDSFVHEDEPPSKRSRVCPSQNKRALPSDEHTDVPADDHVSASPAAQAIDAESLWHEAFRMAHRIAPRVGNLKCEVAHDLHEFVQQLVESEINIHSLFVCRGTNRFQVPLSAPSSHDAPLRRTICMHRANGNLYDLGTQHWHPMTRAQRIASNMPSRLTITVFGNPPQSPHEESIPPSTEHDAADPLRPADSVARAVHPKSAQPKLPTICEGWAPPPTPLHGPCFRALSPEEKQDLVKLHKNLGHPDPKVLSAHLKAQQAPEHVVRAAADFICDACVETQRPRHQRPAKLHPPREFNDVLGIDGFFWRGKRGFQCYVLHMYDEASGFHLAKRLDGRNLDHAIPAFQSVWALWAGFPKNLYLDPAGEFRADQWLSFMQAHNYNTHVHMTAEAWQRGRIERHGAILKDMLHRLDAEQPFESTNQFDEMLTLSCQAKNQLSKQNGYSPEQVVLGKSTALPASLTSDDAASAAHALALGNDLECERFRELLGRRTQARQAFILADNTEAIRRAPFRQSRPMGGPYIPGQLVLYWTKRHTPNRGESGRWHGPAKVIVQEGNSIVWLSHADRLIRRAPESIRPASLREWNSWHDTMPRLLDDVSQIPVPATPRVEEPDHIDAEYSPSIAADLPESEHPETLQPEQEASHPPIINSGDSVNDTPTAESDISPFESDVEDPLEDGHLLQMINLTEIMDESPRDQNLPHEDALHVFDTFFPAKDAQVTDTICLAEDGMPYIDCPVECAVEECYSIEIPLKAEDLASWSRETNPEEMACVAAAGQRARVEVQVKHLSAKERELFDIAKDNELTCWIATNALRPILRKSLNPDQILKSRWVLTWKNVEADGNQPAYIERPKHDLLY